jgi:hypothetical protein
MIRKTAAAILLAVVLAVVSFAHPAEVHAGTKFDGPWSVIIYTKTGPCDRASRFAGQIVDGNITYGGGFVNFTGRVKPNGVAYASVSSGSNYAVATGRMTVRRGSGTWHGQAPSGHCTGTWVATRT